MILKDFKRSEPLSAHTTLRIGGPANFFKEVTSSDEAILAVSKAESMGLPWRVLGHGSNVLAADKGVDGAIIVFKSEISPDLFEDGKIKISGGCALDSLVRYLASEGYAGLEMLVGIPGTVGGAITGNAGAYGVQIGDRVLEVTLLGKNGKIRKAKTDDLGFSYRHSLIKETHEAVLDATIEVFSGDKIMLLNQTEKKLAERAGKHPDPESIPTAGSWFKNPKDDKGKTIAAGRLLEESGCKDLKVGGAHLWHKHANIIVTDGNSSASEVLKLASEMAGRVEKKFGIRLEQEVCYLHSPSPS